MKVSVQNSRVCKEFGVDEGFKMLKEAGFQGVDFNLNGWFTAADIKADNPAPMDQELETLRPLFVPYKEAAEKYGIAFSQTHAPFPYYFPGKDDLNARIQSSMHKTIALNGMLGCKYVVIHPACALENSQRWSEKEEWEVNRRLYSELIPTLKQYGVVACLENLFVSGNVEGRRYSAICSDFRQAADYVDRLNDIAGQECFGFCFDAGHCHLTGQNMRYALNVIGSRLKVLHINDNDSRTDWHVSPYMGNGDWESFIEGLRDIHYQGDLSFETFNVLNRFPQPMWKTALKLIAETGAYFAQRIQA